MSKIQWTNESWNPLAGCSLVSPGCARCYAMRMAARLEAMGQKKYAGTTKKVNGNAVWTGKINLDEKALSIPIGWRKPKRVFVNSMSDLFHEDVPFEFANRAFAVMSFSTQHTFQILTKRPERMAEFMEYRASDPAHVVIETTPIDVQMAVLTDQVSHNPSPLENVWLGTSVEDQKRADERIPWLLKCPAAVRFVSAEPLLGPVDLSRYLHSLDWVIAGGES